MIGQMHLLEYKFMNNQLNLRALRSSPKEEIFLVEVNPLHSNTIIRKKKYHEIFNLKNYNKILRMLKTQFLLLLLPQIKLFLFLMDMLI